MKWEKTFDGLPSFPDDVPLHSVRHPVYINGIEVTGRWLEVHDWIVRQMNVVLDKDGCFDYLENTVISWILHRIFRIVFILFNKKGK